MGRFEKTIITKEGVDRRESGYYSTPQQIADFFDELIKAFLKCLGKIRYFSNLHPPLTERLPAAGLIAVSDEDLQTILAQ